MWGLKIVLNRLEQLEGIMIQPLFSGKIELQKSLVKDSKHSTNLKFIILNVGLVLLKENKLLLIKIHGTIKLYNYNKRTKSPCLRNKILTSI